MNLFFLSSSSSSERKERRDPPKFSEQLSDVTVFEGANAKFQCEVKGKPEAKIEWLKNGEVRRLHRVFVDKFEINVYF